MPRDNAEAVRQALERFPQRPDERLRHRRYLRVEHHLTLEGALTGLGLNDDTLETGGLRE